MQSVQPSVVGKTPLVRGPHGLEYVEAAAPAVDGASMEVWTAEMWQAPVAREARRRWSMLMVTVCSSSSPGTNVGT